MKQRNRDVQNPNIRKLLGQAVISSIAGDKAGSWEYGRLAAEQQKKETYNKRFHASIGEILRAQGREVRG